VPGSVKPTYLAQHGRMVINPKFLDDETEQAIRIAHVLPQHLTGATRRSRFRKVNRGLNFRVDRRSIG